MRTHALLLALLLVVGCPGPTPPAPGAGDAASADDAPSLPPRPARRPPDEEAPSRAEDAAPAEEDDAPPLSTPDEDEDGEAPRAEGPADEADSDEQARRGPPKPDDSWATPGEGSIALFEGIRLYKDENSLDVKGRVCIKQGPTLELMGCTERGKTHESLLLFQCNPKQLHLAMVMIGLKPVPQVGQFGQQIALDKGQKVVLEVSWSADDAPPEDAEAPPAVNGRITRRVEDVIYDRVRKRSMPRVGWVFTGSRTVLVPMPPNWDEKQEVYAAEYAGNVAAVYHDPDALLDTPLIEGGDDTVYVAYSERMPERGTKVIIHLRPWKKGDGPETRAPKASDAAPREPGSAPPGDAPPGGEVPGDPAPGDAPLGGEIPGDPARGDAPPK